MAATDIEFRRRSKDDLPALVEALEDVYSTDGYPIEGTATAVSFLSPPGLVAAWVAVHRGLVVGQIAVVAGGQGHHAAVRAWVDSVGSGGDAGATVVAARFFIRKYARGFGLGRALVEKTCQWAKDNGKRIVINVLAKDQDAMKLYEKLGFRRFGEGEYEYHEGKKATQYFYVY
ncbi:hypothetical protein PFICI_04992 [Pestalotiopsis fici W106-1]|uniref:N-acetyltransferase domain-containing protein n=1 Tax=Pestalotiopsis fici (strain W106-1 / CGMCC3.15140) TaxID=1229662 RepID=W3XD56_PESFW|nr:uncharacterized protein PFICI_04992 [Pestalotiopsis fici W106-1]ETS83116.1 hypothetical protein PFICI_04992 [Pestalotiopsis fici W106-1]